MTTRTTARTTKTRTTKKRTMTTRCWPDEIFSAEEEVKLVLPVQAAMV